MRFKRIAAVFAVMVTALLCACSAPLGSEATSFSGAAQNGMLAVHFIDVGQGDSEFIELPGGETMLIDGGEREYGETVCSYISSLGYSEITYLVATHPHSDHIGGLPQVLADFDVENVYMPNVSSSSAIYGEFLDRVEAEGCMVTQAAASVGVIDENGLCAEFLAPVEDEYSELNNYSAVLKLTYGSTSFLFMGDAEELSEQQITADVSANVIKVGHHGSDTSSSQQFADRVSPQYAVFEVGRDNSYGHPSAETVGRWQNAGAQILRTDLLGNIVITSDGEGLTVNTSQSAETPAETSSQAQTSAETTSAAQKSAEYSYILNTSSKKIHLPDCSYVSDMSEKNKEFTSKSVEQLESEGYTPCKNCMADYDEGHH